MLSRLCPRASSIGGRFKLAKVAISSCVVVGICTNIEVQADEHSTTEPSAAKPGFAIGAVAAGVIAAVGVGYYLQKQDRSPVLQNIDTYLESLADTPHLVRIIMDRSGKWTEEDVKEEFISSEDQPLPFVMGGKSFLELRGKSTIEMFQFIGFQTDYTRDEWLFQKLDGGTRFYMVIFGADESIPATWDGIMGFLRGHHPKCAGKLAPHVETMKTMSPPELVQLAAGVGDVPKAYYDTVSSFDAYVESQENTLQHARAFLRHTLKCTTLYRGDGYAYDDNGTRGTEEVLMARKKISELPLPSTGKPPPIFCLSDDPALDAKVAEYRIWLQKQKPSPK